MSWQLLARQTSRHVRQQRRRNLVGAFGSTTSSTTTVTITPLSNDCGRWYHDATSTSASTTTRLSSSSSRWRDNGPIAIPHVEHLPVQPLFIDRPLDWFQWMITPPKGFENFFPKKDDDDNEKNTEKESTTPPTKKTSQSSKKSSDDNDPFKDFKTNFSKKNKKSSNNNNNNNQGPPNQQDQQQLIPLTIAILLVLALRSYFDDEITSSHEVTWTDFRNYMLESGDVERIHVVNKKIARVYLRPGARGLPSKGGGGAYGHRKDTGGDKTTLDDEDKTVMDMGVPSSSASSSRGDEGGVSSSSRSQRSSHPVYYFTIGSVESFEDKLTKTQEELGVSPRDYVPVKYTTETNWAMELFKSSPVLLLLGIMAYTLRGMGGAGRAGGGGGMGGIFQIGKSNAKKIKREDIDVTFKDVAGCDEAKREIMEFVDFLQDNERFTKLGAKIPKGALLCGPPGTGKTLLAKAVAGEASVPFYSISGSDFIEMFVGVGPSRVRDLFKEARANAPCIVFIDEIDAVGRQRGRGGFSGGNDERENTLNQLLVEMDGFQPTTGVVVLAGTNRVDILDQALTRPGRFDRQITVDKPDLNGRKQIFNVHLRALTLSDSIDNIASRLAGLTPGMAGADIANLCNEAAIQAARRKADAVCLDDFEKATDRIIGGLESHKIMSVEEKTVVAHHEAGHAVGGWFLEHSDPLLKVTIIPRSSGALGYAQYLPKEIFLRTKHQIMDIVCMALAGRAAEEIFFGKVTTGAADDLRRVTDIVYNLIQVYGMNDRVGQLAFPKDPNAMPGDKPYSDATAQAMDEEAKVIVDAAYQRTLDLLTERKEEVEKVALLLLEKETISHDDVYDLIGPRPFKGDKAYEEFVSRRKEDKKIKPASDDEQMKEETEVNGGETGPVIPGLAFKAF